MSLNKTLCLGMIVVMLILSTVIILTNRLTMSQEIQKLTRRNLTDMVNIATGFLELNPDINKAQFDQFINKTLNIGRTGFIMVVNSKGDMVVHRKVQGKNWSKKPFIKKIITEKDGYHRFVSPKTGTWKVVAYKYIPVKDWIVAATNFEEDALEVPITNSTTNSLCAIIPVFFVVMGLMLWIIQKRVIKPLTTAIKFADQIAKGDLSRKISAKGSNNEIGNLINALADMKNNLHTMICEINSGVSNLDSSAAGMSDICNHLGTNIEKATVKSNTVVAAAGEMNSNSQSVAAAVEQASTNTRALVSHVRDISKNLSNMADTAHDVKEETGSAVTKVAFSSSQISKLEQASQEIGTITETIRGISDQTNLLALNAMIESARAGEAGKGFAVVANEIKILAKQTSEATDNINQKLSQTQKLTSITVNEIEEISGAISRIDDSVGAITGAINQQNETTSEIFENISQTADGLQEVNENVSHLSTGINEVTKDISTVNELNSEIRNSGSKVQHDVVQLNGIAFRFNEMVQKFKL